MPRIQKFFQLVFSILMILSLAFSAVQPVSAQGQDGIKIQHNAETGKVNFITTESGRPLTALQALGGNPGLLPADPAMALAQRYGKEFGLKDPSRELSTLRTDHPGGGRLTVRYQQEYQGIPVMGGELVVNTDENGDLYSMNGEVSPDLSLPTQPTIDSEQAKESALRGMAKWYQASADDFVITEPELWIFDESLLQTSSRPAELVWRMEAMPKDEETPVRELVLINAETGNPSLHFNQIDTAWHTAKMESIRQDDETAPTETPTPLPTELPPVTETPVPTETSLPASTEFPSPTITPQTTSSSFGQFR